METKLPPDFREFLSLLKKPGVDKWCEKNINGGGDHMRPNEIKSEIEKLSLAEKLLLIEDVWDSIAEKSAGLPMPEWQKRELDKRYGEYMSGSQHLHDWRSVHEDLRNSNK